MCNCFLLALLTTLYSVPNSQFTKSLQAHTLFHVPAQMVTLVQWNSLNRFYRIRFLYLCSSSLLSCKLLLRQLRPLSEVVFFLFSILIIIDDDFFCHILYPLFNSLMPISPNSPLALSLISICAHSYSGKVEDLLHIIYTHLLVFSVQFINFL